MPEPEGGKPHSYLLLIGEPACSSGVEDIPIELADRRKANEALFRTCFERAAAEGDLQSKASPVGLARQVATVLQGLSMQAAGSATRAKLREVAQLALAAFPTSLELDGA